MRLKNRCVLRVEELEDRSLPSANFVLDWNSLLINMQEVRSQGNQQAARSLAIMGAAVYDSVNAIDPTHTVYHVDARAFPGVTTASADAAAAQAAHDVAYALYTQTAERIRVDNLLATQLAQVPNGQAENNGIALGQFVAAQMLAWRANDGSTATVLYTIGNQPGDWQPTPPAFAQTPATPQWPYVTPFALTSGSQFRPGPPPELTSADYTAAFNEVKSLGSATSTTRTAEQTEIAYFWAGVGVSNAGVAIWSQIAQTAATSQGLNLAQNARLFAQMSVAAADAFIAGFDAKYFYDYWRPVTAIRAADTDGNPQTLQDASWTPLIATPNHQSYVSLHSSQSRAAAETLAAFFGTDHVGFTATWAGVERSFNKFTDAAKEAGKSRIYAGIHWSFDSAQGEQLGRKIGEYVADHFFLPLAGSKGAHAAPAQFSVNFSGDKVQPLGFDTSALHSIDVRMSDLMPCNQGEVRKSELLTGLDHEFGHLLGHEHEDDGSLQKTLTAGTRRNVDATFGTPFALFAVEDDGILPSPVGKRK